MQVSILVRPFFDNRISLLSLILYPSILFIAFLKIKKHERDIALRFRRNNLENPRNLDL